MGDRLEDLGDVTYQDLYKLHTGHRLDGFSEDSDTSSESEVFKYEHLKPPPYTYEEITHNLLTLEGSLLKEKNIECKNKAVHSYSSGFHSSPSSSEKNITKLLPASVHLENVTSEDKQPVTPCEKIAYKLSHLITRYCFICHKAGPKHYRQEGHYKNVTKWLEVQTKEINQSVDIKLFFCQICNLPLSGNDESEKHYEEETHKEKAKSFCLSCRRVIEAIDMPSHCKSKKHLANVEPKTCQWSKSEENGKKLVISATDTIQASSAITNGYSQDRKENQIPNSSLPLNGVHKKNASSPLKSYASVLKGTVNKKGAPQKLKTVETKKSEIRTTQTTKKNSSDREVLDQVFFIDGQDNVNKKPERENNQSLLFNPLALILIGVLGRTFCHLCEEPVHRDKGNHYRKKQHYKVLREWIEKDGLLFGYNMDNIDSVFCFPCHYILPSFASAQKHYSSKEHEKFSKYFCDVCMTHDNSEIHKNHKGGLHLGQKPVNETELAQVNVLTKEDHSTKRNSKKKKQVPTEHTKDNCRTDVNRVIKVEISTSSKLNSREQAKISDTFHTHGGLETKEQANELSISNPDNVEGLNPDAEYEPGEFISKKLNNMLSTVYCHICKTNNVNHYLTKEHIINLRNWLNIMIQNTGIKLDRQLIFCEDCDVILSGTEKSLSHYETQTHFLNKLRYCSVCIFRGSPDKVSLHHHSKEHHENLRDLQLLNKSNIGDSLLRIISEEVTSPNDAIVEHPQFHPSTVQQTKSSKPNLHLTQNSANKNNKPSSSDNKNMNILHLGIRLGQYVTEKIVTESTEHVELCKNIYTDYWHLVTMLETVPLEVCSTYLRKFIKEIGETHKKYVNTSDENEMESKITKKNVDNLIDQNIQQNETTESILAKKSLNFKMVKLKATLTECLNRKYSISAVNEVRWLIMVVRNFKKSLEVIKPEENSFKIESVFQFTDEHYPEFPHIEYNLEILEYEVYKTTLRKEIEQLSSFIINQKLLNCDVVSDYLSQFNSKLLRRKNECDELNCEEEKLHDYFFNTEHNGFLFKNELGTQANTNSTATTRTVVNSLENNVKSNLSVPTEINCENGVHKETKINLLRNLIDNIF